MRTAIILYTVRALDEPLEDVLDRVAAANYDGVQLPNGFLGEDPADAAAALEERDLSLAGVHVGIDDLEERFDETMADLETVGATDAVISWLDEEHFESREACQETAGRLDELAARCADRGVALHYHNHDHEFTDLGDATGYEVVLEATEEVGFELDVGWARVGGADPAALIRRIGDRGPLLHVKDMTTDGDFRELEEGEVDLETCADAASEAGVEWLVYENDEPEDPAETIDRNAPILRELADR